MNTWIEHLRRNDYEKIASLIAEHEDVNALNEESGESVLMYAIRYRCDRKVLDLLIESGADIYALDHEGVSVFDMAITYNNIDMVNYFLDKDIDVNATQRKSGFTPLMCASAYGRSEIVRLLLDKGADKEAMDVKGFTATDFSRKMNKKSVLVLLDYDENAPKNTSYAK